MSDNVREYLEERGIGRQPLSARRRRRDPRLPDDAYYVDGEVGLADLIVQRRLNDWWSTYLTFRISATDSGAFDSTIESFHDAVGFSQQGRDLVARNQFQIVYGSAM